MNLLPQNKEGEERRTSRRKGNNGERSLLPDSVYYCAAGGLRSISQEMYVIFLATLFSLFAFLLKRLKTQR